MAKLKASYPFRNIGLAVAFSPRLEQHLQEAWNLANIFRSNLVLIHIGKFTKKKELKLFDMCVRCNLESSRFKVIWEPGDITDKIVDICEQEHVDLLVEGATKKEGFLKQLISSKSRDICRHVKCSVLMLTEKPLSGLPSNKIVVNGINHVKTINTINTSLYFGKKIHASSLDVIEEVAVDPGKRLDDLAIKRMKQILLDQDRIPKFIETLSTNGLKVTYQSVKGEAGKSIANYAMENQANLIAVNSPDSDLTMIDRIFPHDIEYLLADLPCHLLIVHERN